MIYIGQIIQCFGDTQKCMILDFATGEIILTGDIFDVRTNKELIYKEFIICKCFDDTLRIYI